MTMPNTRYARAGLLVAGLLGGMVGTASNQAKPPPKLDYVTVNGVRLPYVTAGERPLISTDVVT